MGRRIASLLPSTTEIVCALGGIDDLVGVSHECDHPPEVARRVAAGELPVLTTARLGPPGPLGATAGHIEHKGVGMSAAIDAQLRRLVAEALAVYIVDERQLAAAAPDLVLTQDLCDVCAVSYEETCRAVVHLSGAVEVLTTHPQSLHDILEDIRRIGAAIDRSGEAVDLVHTYILRIKAVGRRAEAAAAASGRPAVLTLEWIDPPMPGGLWMGELVEIAGGTPLGDQAGLKTHALSTEQLAGMQPEVVMVKPCGFTLAQGLAELPTLQRILPPTWPAVRAGRVYVADGSAYFNRPGPRIIDSLELLAACIHPAAFVDFAELYGGSYLAL
jgi:iron complex transport system substrate-binding protein